MTMVIEEASKALFMDNIEEFVFDESRLVTYKWLSQTLGVHVNTAKQLLYEFSLINRKKNGSELNITYFVAGTSTLEDGTKCHRCHVLSEDELENEKASLSSVTSCHIYSIQTARLKNTDPLYISDYDIFKTNSTCYNEYGSIQHPNLQTRSTKFFNEKCTADDIMETKQSPTGKYTSTERKRVQPQSKKPSRLMGMFENALKSSNNNAKRNTVKTEALSADQISEPSKPGFQNRSLKKKKDVCIPRECDNDNKGAETFASAAAKIVETKKVSTDCSGASKSNNNSKPTSTTTVDMKAMKNRQRLCNLESSSDEEMEADPESPTPVLKKPSPVRSMDVDQEDPLVQDEVIKVDEKSSKDDVTLRKRKRVRKLVPKTFIDEEGYMVTEKVWETESTDASECEEPIPKRSSVEKDVPRVETTKKAASKKSSPSKNETSKQQKSITSFFKKA